MNTESADCERTEMDEVKGIVKQELCEYGSIRVKLADVMQARKISRNRLHVLTNIKYDVITRYYKGENIIMVDLDLLARICYVLNCKIEDLLEYRMEDKDQPSESDV